MKLLCILIALTFVNVSPIMTAGYANSVYTTTQYIKKANDTNPAGLETALLNIINGDRSIETLNLMLATPEKAIIGFTIDHDDSFISNLPEHIAIADQMAVQNMIFQVTNIDVPSLGPNENFGNVLVGILADQRRGIIGKIIKKLLIAAIDKGTPRFPNLNEICRLLAVVRSIRFPDAYIKIAVVDPSENCCKLTSRNARFRYKPRRGSIEAVRPISPDFNELVNILDEIKFWFR
ncbi:uncharacterized protein LOC126842401 [Adelges cooleyi]|uniref:uncharacterized protein LOC126842401 n=1 Tax=Adelges cooleyi TaxID=133065 RepID=UPI00217F5313|nr:uncharacterized protein LOC126842401 [Adelges cooleyi]